MEGVNITERGLAAFRNLGNLIEIGLARTPLTDRGLEAAITALAARSPLVVTIEADLPGRVSPAAEAAAYFVVAEALANAAKHSDGANVLVHIEPAQL